VLAREVEVRWGVDGSELTFLMSSMRMECVCGFQKWSSCVDDGLTASVARFATGDKTRCGKVVW
jgi:hypothetical protein